MIANKYFIFFFTLAMCRTKSVHEYPAVYQIEDYIETKRSELNPRYRQHYHVTPPVGWLSDPNGFTFYKGEFHIFYQYYPYSSEFGTIHWGHASSKNLVDWKTLPTALIPDNEMCFSGCAIVVNETLVLMYTSRYWADTVKYPHYNETQHLAFSKDGIHFKKYEKNPVITITPNNANDFRDPKIWKHDKHYYAIIGSKTGEHTDHQLGRALLYRSSDLLDWEFLRVFGESSKGPCFMWENPDLFEMNGRFIFLLAPQGMDPKGDRYKNIHQTGYIIGQFNYKTFKFVPETDFMELDYGHDFYTAQTLEKDGKRYLVSWCSAWSNSRPEADDGWAGTLTMFRELELVGDRLLMKPVQDMVTLRAGLVMDGKLLESAFVEIDQAGEAIIDADLNKAIHLTITGLHGGETATIKWDPKVKKVMVDKYGDDRQVKWVPIGSHSWRLFLDASSLELFCGEGEVVFSTRLYPDGKWVVTNLSPQALHVKAYKLRRSVPP